MSAREDYTIRCNQHGERLPAYVVCAHVLKRGAVVAKTDENDGRGPGYILCATCLAKNRLTNPAIICRACGVARGWLQPQPLLVDVEALHRKHPSTFPINALTERERVTAGQFVKLVWCGTGSAERMWVKVVKREADGTYIGTLENNPVVFESKLKFGQAVHFAPRHIAVIGGIDH
jgi:hypothetical protein